MKEIDYFDFGVVIDFLPTKKLCSSHPLEIETENDHQEFLLRQKKKQNELFK